MCTYIFIWWLSRDKFHRFLALLEDKVYLILFGKKKSIRMLCYFEDPKWLFDVVIYTSLFINSCV